MSFHDEIVTHTRNAFKAFIVKHQFCKLVNRVQLLIEAQCAVSQTERHFPAKLAS